MFSPYRKSPVVIGLILFLFSSAFAYSGGSGEPNNPYQIATKADLLALAANTADYGKCFVLTADIDLNPNLPGGQVFTTAVIARHTDNTKYDFDGTAFTGIFDGAGHKVINLTINTNGDGNLYLGLFGYVNGGEIKNLGIENISITSGDHSYNLGGLVGSNGGTISNCFSTGIVTSGANSYNLGGLVGWNNYGTISNCYSTGTITGGNWSAGLGGIVGLNYYYSPISNCYSTSDVTGGDESYDLGGLVGVNSWTISNCYSTGNVSVSGVSYFTGNISGGLVGWNGGTISNCYSTSIVSAGDNYTLFHGGLVGSNNGSISSCYFLITSGTDNGNGTPLTDGQMKQQSNFVGWDFDTVWDIIEGVSYPWLREVPPPPEEHPKFLTLPFKNPSIIISQGWVYNWSNPPSHNGLDYVKGGTSTSLPFEVVAAADGWAMQSEQPRIGTDPTYGKFVLIRHAVQDASGNDYFTLYAHLGSIRPEIPYQDRLSINYTYSNPDKWKPIHRGELLGVSGNTGAAESGVHLHFEVQRKAYAQFKTDPYDLRTTRDYYPGYPQYTTCGPSYLWITDPPVSADRIVAKVHSPVELMVFDSQGRATGLQSGQVKNEIPFSTYSEDTVTIFFPLDSYYYEVVGISEGTYGLDITSVNEGNATTFKANGIPTMPSAVHSYDVNWVALSEGKEGVMLSVDRDGDGNIDRVITSDANLTAEEFDSPPVANAGLDQTVYAWIDGIAEVNLDGSGSYDDDNDLLTYKWSWTIDGNDYDANGVKPTIELPVGVHTIQLIVNDGIVDSEPNEVVETIVGPVEADLCVTPKVLNCRSNQPRIAATLQLPKGITKDQIDTRQPILLYPGEIEATQIRISQDKDKCRVLHTVIQASFDKNELMDAIPDNGRVELVVVGQLKIGQYFFGSDNISVICPGHWPWHRPWFDHRWNRRCRGLATCQH